MNQEQLKEEIVKVLEDVKVGTLATIEGNKPHTRYMTFLHDNLTLYTPTSKKTHKVDELEKNPYVHILIGYTGKGFGDSYIEVEASAAIREDKDLKEKFWRKEFEMWFDGPEDEDYVLLECKPGSVTLMNEGGKTPATLNL